MKRYATPIGHGLETDIESHKKVRLETRGEETVLLAWLSQEPLAEIAGKIGQLASIDSRVSIIRDHDLLEPVSRKGRLAAYLARTSTVELVRIDLPDYSVVWQSEKDDSPELSVLARSWDEASRLANELGAPEVSAVVPDLAQELLSADYD